MTQTVFALLLAVTAFGSVAHAADPQPYKVQIAAVGDGDMEATLNATSDLQSLRGSAPVSPFGLIARARSDVDRLTTALESFGYYHCAVTIRINGMMLNNSALGDVSVEIGRLIEFPNKFFMLHTVFTEFYRINLRRR